MKPSAALALLALTGCGYHLAGRGDLIPKSVKTIAIPAFGNGTPRYQLARLLPADIAREFITRTRYKVLDDPGQADAVLRGSLVNFANYPTIFDPTSGRATGVQVIVIVRVDLVERATGKTIFSRPTLEFRERYTISTEPQSYFDESGTAMIRVSKDVAQTVVTAILENF